MFEWLKKDYEQVQTEGFHRFIPLSSVECQQLACVETNLQASYVEFLHDFGRAKLFRASLFGYHIGVVFPKVIKAADDSDIYDVGFADSALIRIRHDRSTGKQGVYRVNGSRERRVANDFEEWLHGSCTQARRAYTKERWEEIVAGPAPFTPDERQIVAARRNFRWHFRSTDEDGNIVLEIHNESTRSLPALTLGVRSTDRRLNGAVRIDVHDLAPGQSTVRTVGIYKGLVPVEQIELFDLPDPNPAERNEYFELKELCGLD